MKEKSLNLDKLEEVKFKIEKEAFEPKALTCSRCSLNTKKKEIELNLGGDVSIRLSGFECPKCKKRYLGLKEAQKLDKALVVSRILRNDFKLERSLSFDGDNFTFRIPKEFTRDVHKSKVDIIPLGAKQFCAFIR